MSNTLWLPIDSAPKDGRIVLLFGLWAGEISGIDDDNPRVGVGYWTGGRTDYQGFDWYCAYTDAYAAWWKPSHWSPLPEPPK
jgi:hypothetical protein